MKSLKKFSLGLILIFISILVFGCGDEIKTDSPTEFIKTVEEINKDDKGYYVKVDKLLFSNPNEDQLYEFKNTEAYINNTNDIKKSTIKSNTELLTTDNNIISKQSIIGTLDNGIIEMQVKDEYSNLENIDNSINRYFRKDLNTTNSESEEYLNALKADETSQLITQFLSVYNKLKENNDIYKFQFVDKIINKMFIIEENKKEETIKLSINFNYVGELVKKILNMSLEEIFKEIVNNQSYDVNKFISKFFNMTYKDIFNYFNDNGVSNQELISLLDTFAKWCVKIELIETETEDVNFTLLLKEIIDFEGNSMYDFIKDEKLMNTMIFIELGESDIEASIEELQMIIKMKVIDIILKDEKVNEAFVIKTKIDKAIDTIISMCNNCFDFYEVYDLSGKLQYIKIAGQINKTKVPDDNEDNKQLIEEMGNINIEFDLTIKKNDKLNSDYNAFNDRIDNYYNSISLTNQEISFKIDNTVDSKNSIKPKYDENGKLIGLDIIYLQNDFIQVYHYTILGKESFTIKEDCEDWIELTFDNGDTKSYILSDYVPSNFDLDEYINSIEDKINQFNYGHFISTSIYSSTNSLRIFYNTKTKEYYESSNNTLHDYVVDANRSYEGRCEEYGYKVSSCSKCHKDEVDKIFVSHHIQEYETISLKEYEIDSYELKVFGCTNCDCKYCHASLFYIGNSYESYYQSIGVEKGDTYKIYTYQIFDSNSDYHYLGIKEYNDEKSMELLINYDKETKTYDKKVEFGK